MNIQNFPVWKWTEPGQHLKGTVMAAPFPVGKKRSILYVIKEDGKRGKSWRMYGTFEIDRRCHLLQPGNKVSIKYLGEVPSEKNPNHTFFHFKINISTTGEPVDETRQSPAARAHLARQRVAGPLHVVGRAVGSGAAAKIEPTKEKKKRGRPRKEAAPVVAAAIEPPRPAEMAVPTPPPGYGRPAFLDNWKAKIKKI